MITLKVIYFDWSLGNEGSCNTGYTFKDLDI